MDFKEKTYTFKDIPKKREYILNRQNKIYDVDRKTLEKIIDSIEIKFREQKEKGASNHKTRKVYVSLREIDRYGIKNKKDFLKYLEKPESVLTHEVTHIFQNIFDSFPDVKYVKIDNNGDQTIDYKKYIGDPGENQARIEQIVELLKWGFGKSEIINLLYSRKHNDPKLWRKLVDRAIDVNEKFGSSKLPLDDEGSTKKQQDKTNDYWIRNKKDRGNNYEDDYISSGHTDEWFEPITHK